MFVYTFPIIIKHHSNLNITDFFVSDTPNQNFKDN